MLTRFLLDIRSNAYVLIIKGLRIHCRESEKWEKSRRPLIMPLDKDVFQLTVLDVISTSFM